MSIRDSSWQTCPRGTVPQSSLKMARSQQCGASLTSSQEMVSTMNVMVWGVHFTSCENQVNQSTMGNLLSSIRVKEEKNAWHKTLIYMYCKKGYIIVISLVKQAIQYLDRWVARMPHDSFQIRVLRIGPSRLRSPGRRRWGEWGRVISVSSSMEIQMKFSVFYYT